MTGLLLSLPSRNLQGNVFGSALADRGLFQADWPGRGGDVTQLLNNPGCRRVCSNVDMQDLSTSMSDEEPDVEKLEARRRHNEEVHCADRVSVIS